MGPGFRKNGFEMAPCGFAAYAKLVVNRRKACRVGEDGRDLGLHGCQPENSRQHRRLAPGFVSIAAMIRSARAPRNLQLDSSATFTGSAALFGAGDSFDFRDIAFAPQTTLAYGGDLAGDTLTVAAMGQTGHAALLGPYTRSSFIASDDQHGGTLVSFAGHQ